MQTQTMRVRLNFTQDLLGSLPADKELHTRFIAAKVPPVVQQEEGDVLDNHADRGLTVFAQDNTGVFLWNYHIKGFFKNAGNVLKEQAKIKNLRGKLDDCLFIKERRIYLLRNNAVITEEDEILERPLRAMTMQGPRVTLAASEVIHPPAHIEFTVILVNHKEVTLDTLRTLLDYGKLQGLGQWRNGGYGQFTWQEIALA